MKFVHVGGIIAIVILLAVMVAFASRDQTPSDRVVGVIEKCAWRNPRSLAYQELTGCSPGSHGTLGFYWTEITVRKSDGEVYIVETTGGYSGKLGDPWPPPDGAFGTPRQ